MKRILAILALLMMTGICFADDAGIPFQVWVSTDTANYVYNGSCRVDEIYIINRSTNVATVKFYDNSTEKFRVEVASPTATVPFADRDLHFSTAIKFFTNCTVTCGERYGANTVLLQGVKQ